MQKFVICNFEDGLTSCIQMVKPIIIFGQKNETPAEHVGPMSYLLSRHLFLEMGENPSPPKRELKKNDAL
jgi:hypothetical protein